MARLVRISSRGANYKRGGLTFSVATAQRLPDGRLAILVDETKAAELGEDNMRALATDPSITIEAVGPDGITAAERTAQKRAAGEAQRFERDAAKAREARAKQAEMAAPKTALKAPKEPAKKEPTE
jgi:hypothetical protein